MVLSATVAGGRTPDFIERRRIMLRAISSILLIAALSASAVADVAFTDGPTISKDAQGAIIRFALSEATDVEVAVIDGAGKVVRHLAAGRVGAAKAAGPLKADSLKQALRWDRTDDVMRLVDALETLDKRVRIGISHRRHTPPTSEVVGNSRFRFYR